MADQRASLDSGPGVRHGAARAESPCRPRAITRKEFIQRERDIATQRVTALVTTHVKSVAQRCNRLSPFAGGQLVSSGTPGEFVARSALVVALVVAFVDVASPRALT